MQYIKIWNFRSNRLLVYWVVLAILVTGCTLQSSEPIQPESNKNLVGLGTFFQMEAPSDTLRISDYFLHPELIDSIKLNSKSLINTENKIMLHWSGNYALAPLSFYSKDTIFSILVKKSQKQPYTIVYPSEVKNDVVQAKGEFNNWNPLASNFIKNDSVWEYKLWLAPGQYQYQLVINGQELLDPLNPVRVSNGMGGYNSLITLADSSATPKLVTHSFDKDKIRILASNTDTIFALWQNQIIAVKPTDNNNEYSIDIPSTATHYKRSFIRVLASGGTKISNDLLIPLQNGKVVNNPALLTRTDKEASILYFMMVDRFKDGNPANNHPLHIPEVNPKVDYYGGDIAGVTSKIKDGYFDSLGISTLWLSPIVQNPEGPYGLYPTPKTKFSAYHGYWPISFNRIDYRLGTPKELHDLVRTAHEHNMNVLLDFVANHVHKEHPIYKEHPEWATNLYLPDGSLNTERWDDHRLTTWFDTFLPTLDLTNPEITNILTDSAVFWLNEYNLDGFRHDATKHIPQYFWRTLTRKIKEQVIIPHNKQIFQIGETYGSRELIASYINSGELDAQFDFNLYDAALQAFANPTASFKNVATALHESQKYYGSHHLMGNISGNQDKPRFMALADGSLRFDEDSKFAGWNRNIQVQDTTAYKKLVSFMAFNLTVPGVPVIYYGDEIGMTGANDPDNRRMMRFNHLNKYEQSTLNSIQKLSKFRKQNLALIYGDLNLINITDSTMLYSRNYFGNTTYVLFNKSSKEAEFTLAPQATSLTDINGTNFNVNNGQLTVSVPAFGYKIIYNE